MKLDEARTLALSLMDHHGITPKWSFEFDRAEKRNGATHFATKKITLSTRFVQYNNEATVLNTILHEIAHVLVGPLVKPHGAQWQRTAKSIGCNAERCTASAAPPVGRYQAHCPGGFLTPEHVATAYTRRPGPGMLRNGACNEHNKFVTWYDTKTGTILSASRSTVKIAAEKPQAKIAAKPWNAGATSIDEMWGEA